MAAKVYCVKSRALTHSNVDVTRRSHVAEHAAFWELLSGPRGEVATRIDDFADELDAHIAAEERTFTTMYGQ